MKTNDFERLLSSVGFVMVRGGKHKVWSNGVHNVAVPWGRTINRMVARRELKKINFAGSVPELNYG
jgi:hypothetical protein